jgi:hypothetical protein
MWVADMATLSTLRIHEYHWSEWVAACEAKRESHQGLQRIEIFEYDSAWPQRMHRPPESLSTPGLVSYLLATGSSHVPTISLPIAKVFVAH